MSNRIIVKTGQTRTTRRMRTIGAIMASGSLIAIIAIGLPWADEYQRLRREAAEFDGLQVQLIEAQHRQKQLDQIEKKISEQLDAAINGSTTPQNTQAVREQLIDFVRESGGRLRRLEIGIGRTRRWAANGDDPRADSPPLDQQESRFLLHKHKVELQAEGSLMAVRRVLERIASQGWLMTTENLKVMPTGIPETPVKLEIQIFLYGIGPGERTPSEEFALHVGTGQRL